jgi:hypothetical protein
VITFPIPPAKRLETTAAASYYYRSFSCFFAKIFRMTSFASREAMTTAAAAGAVDFSASRIHFIQTNLSAD